MKLALTFLAVLAMTTTFAADWPQWRGPGRNGISNERLAGSWPESGPKVIWRASVGTGFSSVAISHGRALTLGNQADRDTVWCFDALTGKELWRYTYPAALGPQYYEGGPAATLTIDDGKAYTISKWGDIFCLDAATGRVVWQRDLRKEGIRTNRWGFAGSPLIWKDLVIFNAGEAGVALSRLTGNVVWSNGTNSTGYASPTLYRKGAATQILIFGAKYLIAVDPKTGYEHWRFPWETRWDTNNPDPIEYDNKIFISSFSAGSALIALKGDKPTPVYVSTEMYNHLSPGVLINGYLYGFSGEAKQVSDFRCLKMSTGKALWTSKDPAMGSVIVVDNKLVLLSEKGELIVAKLSSEGWAPEMRAQILGGLCWTPPSFANGLLYARNAKGDLVCVALSEHVKP